MTEHRAVPDAAIRIDNVTKRYTQRRKPDRLAVNALSLDIQPGQWLALLGPNGSGKSTLMRMLTGLDHPGEGRIDVLGADPTTRRSAHRIGVVFQKPSLDPLLTIRENLQTQAALFNLPGARSRATSAATRLDIHDRLDDRVNTLSGGLARRADLARALINDPDLLLLDEPTTGLDLAARQAFLDTITSLRRDAPSLTVVMTTHHMDEAERAGQVAMLHDGRLVALDTPAALRRACGEHLIRSDHPAAADTLRALGLAPHHANASTRAALTPDGPAVTEVVATLADHDIPFDFGPPTLADAYLALTGRTLQGEPTP